MLRPDVALDPCDIYLAAGNRNDEILQGCQRYWIAEAIRYTHREAVEELFADHNPTIAGQTRKRAVLTGWPELPSIERLPPRKTLHYPLKARPSSASTPLPTSLMLIPIFSV